MANNKATSKRYKVDFFVVTLGGSRKQVKVRSFLGSAENGRTAPQALVDGEDEEHMIRSLVPLNNGTAYKGVFGRCRYNETPVQGNREGKERDVKLLPGHGLVEKNHFLYFAETNLLIYQRNNSGSHSSKFQHYLNKSIQADKMFLLEPILSHDAYSRMLNGGAIKWLELSFQLPKDASLFENLDFKKAAEFGSESNAVSAKLRLTVGRTEKRLAERFKNGLAEIAKTDIAKVARVKLEDFDEPIDLIAERIVETIEVDIAENGRPDPDDVFRKLQAAKDKRAQALNAFFKA